MKTIKLATFVAMLAITAVAKPPNTPTIDGRPLEYDPSELRGSHSGTLGSFGVGNVITNLYVTWDTNYLYIALQGYESNNKLVVMLDVDPTNGTGATTTTNWVSIAPDFIRYNDVGWIKSPAVGANSFGLDYMLSSEGFYNNVLRILYDGEDTPATNNVIPLFDLPNNGNGATPLGTPVDMAVQSDATSNDLKGFEARIPWSVLYGANTGRFGIVQAGEIVPRGATLRLFANIHNNDSAICFSSDDAIPAQTSGNASYAGGRLTTDDYIDVPVDTLPVDGIPDTDTSGDVNAPYLRALQGAQGRREILALFNEALNASTATTPGNWSVNGDTPASIVMTQTNGVLLQLTNDLPAAGNLVQVSVTNVQDTAGNTRLSYNYLSPGVGGLTTSLTVRFILETASGLGLSPGSTSFFINGGGLPLEFGFPPATSSPLSPFSGSLYYRDVTFPPGTPSRLNYKYSGIITSTGTNTYEAVRLADYQTATRILTLDTNGTFMTVTDYLGAAAAPYRDPGTNSGYIGLFSDQRRGDAGVRDRTTVRFQLDLRNFSTQGVDRVLLQGSDPLRGFNIDGENPGVSDFATAPLMSYLTAGLALYDDGTHGDTNSGDRLYARDWVLSTDGYDATFEPTSPNSLVGAGEFDPPYQGDDFWISRRSPRSFIYKYYVHMQNGAAFDSQSGNIEVYVEGSPTNIVLPTYAWDNNGIPPPPPSNAPIMVATAPTGTDTRVTFVNLPSEVAHGVHVSTNLTSAWLDYGQRASGSGGNWTAIVQGVGAPAEFYRAYAGLGLSQQRAFWTPNPIPDTGATLRVYFNQIGRNLAGQRDVRWFGRILGGGFTNLIPMVFTNQGGWYVDVPVPPATTNSVQFLFSKPGLGLFDKTYKNGDFFINVGGRASWSPEMPTQNGPFTVTYNSSNGVLATATQMFLHLGFDNFLDHTSPQMTNTLGTNVPGIWTITLTVPPTHTNAVDWVFKNGTNDGTATFDNNSAFDWRAFILQP